MIQGLIRSDKANESGFWKEVHKFQPRIFILPTTPTIYEREYQNTTSNLPSMYTCRFLILNICISFWSQSNTTLILEWDPGTKCGVLNIEQITHIKKNIYSATIVSVVQHWLDYRRKPNFEFQKPLPILLVAISNHLESIAVFSLLMDWFSVIYLLPACAYRYHKKKVHQQRWNISYTKEKRVKWELR